MKNNSILVIGVVAVIIFVIYRGNQKKKVKPVENATQEVAKSFVFLLSMDGFSSVDFLFLFQR